MPIHIEQLNQLSSTAFINTLGDIFEHSPWVAEQAYAHRPFHSCAALHQHMSNTLQTASAEQRLQVIREHPELAGKAAQQGALSTHSHAEQAGAGLDQCSTDVLQQLQHLNRDYRQKFGFPFIIAVSGLSQQQIIAAMLRRLDHCRDTELTTSIDEICQIAKIRLQALIRP